MSLTLLTFFEALQEAYQPAFNCSKSTMETPEQCVKSLQS